MHNVVARLSPPNQCTYHHLRLQLGLDIFQSQIKLGHGKTNTYPNYFSKLMSSFSRQYKSHVQLANRIVYVCMSGCAPRSCHVLMWTIIHASTNLIWFNINYWRTIILSSKYILSYSFSLKNNLSAFVGRTTLATMCCSQVLKKSFFKFPFSKVNWVSEKKGGCICYWTYSHLPSEVGSIRKVSALCVALLVLESRYQKSSLMRNM